MLNLSGRELLQFPEEPHEGVGLGRARYLEIGMALMLLKYAVDAALIYAWVGVLWTPADYVFSLANLANTKASSFPAGLTFILLMWTVPFVWTGVVLSVRRARDAALPLWLIVLFFIPIANYVLMLTLAAWPSATSPVVVPASDSSAGASRYALVLGTAAGLATGLVLGFSGTLALETYGLSVFIATPFVSTASAAFIAARLDPRFESSTHVVFTTLGSLFVTFVIVAFEGIVCLVMAMPLIIPVALLGGLLGHALARTGSSRATTIALMMAATAGGQAVDAATEVSTPREVMTAIEIAAPPDAVWRNVVSFAEIRRPPEWLFRTGLAYPLRARIEGRGAGAVRHCEFSTGAFVEPITAWEEPTRLAFDVVSQPPALREWSPYGSLQPPHLEGFFKTSRGEFRLVPLPDGRTRLEGRTWYVLRMQPQGYWTFIADAILHRIHTRVLDHIRQEAEAGR